MIVYPVVHIHPIEHCTLTYTLKLTVKNETLQQQKDYFNFTIANFPFICSNIPVAPVYGVNIL